MSPAAGFDLCLITDGSQAHIRAIDQVLAGLSTREAGAVAVQLRMKGIPPATVRAAAASLRARTRASGAALYLNLHTPGVAPLSLDADGVQLPGGHFGAAPDHAGAGLRVGASCHDAAQIDEAAAAGAHFVVLAPFASVPGKGPALGPEGFSALSRASPLPVVALGGIDAVTAPRALAAGACALACIRGVLEAPDPAASARALLEHVADARQRAAEGGL